MISINWLEKKLETVALKNFDHLIKEGNKNY